MFERPLSGKADIRNLFASPMAAGLLRESVLHRYAQCCIVVRGRLLIHFLNQSVNTQDLDSGGRGRKFESSHPDQVLEVKGPFNLLVPFSFWACEEIGTE
jgi:hypothetical protein